MSFSRSALSSPKKKTPKSERPQRTLVNGLPYTTKGSPDKRYTINKITPIERALRGDTTYHFTKDVRLDKRYKSTSKKKEPSHSVQSSPRPSILPVPRINTTNRTSQVPKVPPVPRITPKRQSPKKATKTTPVSRPTPKKVTTPRRSQIISRSSSMSPISPDNSSWERFSPQNNRPHNDEPKSFFEAFVIPLFFIFIGLCMLG